MKKHLTKEDVTAIQKNLIDEFGGLHGIRDENLLDSSVMRPQSGYYNNIYEEASALMESLALNHSFIDGNKRISFFATDVFLRMNGYFIDCETENAHQFYIENLENNSFRFENILQWLKKNTRPLQ
ncbi:MAG: type II toxin-antitoxin system death-on-curing family toxin [Melioribacteraceae bacterium]|jgi:death-on-curing protein|nr:type II toxin-antitoxin system death-on-curing family toxin [Melioribacteraceae bacterium]